MPRTSDLLIGLGDVAELAEVARPVVSMWRTRHARSGDPFPAPVADDLGSARFSADEVASWLGRTGRGRNPHAVVDVAASATPAGYTHADPVHAAGMDALLALRAATGDVLGDLAPSALIERAAAVDPHDEALRGEIVALAQDLERARDWAGWADRLTDAAYSPAGAARVIERRHRAERRMSASAGPLSAAVGDLLAAAARSLRTPETSALALSAGVLPTLAITLIDAVGDDLDVAVDGDMARAIRRRLLTEAKPPPVSPGTGPLLRVIRATSRETTIDTLDDAALSLSDYDRALFVAPARLLTDELPRADEQARSAVLRSGRVRAIVRLSAGHVMTAPREALAIWVFGREVGDVAPADRYTAVADLSDRRLTPATRADLVSDIVAAMGSARDVRGHAFRFTRLVRTTSLQAASASLMPETRTEARAVSDPRPRDLPALIDMAQRALDGDAPPLRVVETGRGGQPRTATVAALLADGHLRIVPGTRVGDTPRTDLGLEVVTAAGLDDPDAPRERIDPLEFAARHPSAALTRPGDVVFRTAPTPRAWVDVDGSKVVAYPARVLRITADDPGGLVPELVAADIAQSVAGPGAWRRWTLRRVDPAQSRPLRDALAAIATARAELTERLRALDRYADLVAEGVATRAVTISPTDPPLEIR